MNFMVSGKHTDKVTKETTRWQKPILASLAEGNERFRGRPLLAQRILPGFQDLHCELTQRSAERSLANLQYFWLFLDDQERASALLDVSSHLRVDDLSWLMLEGVWRNFISWLREIPESRLCKRSKYNINQGTYAVFRRSFELAVELGETDRDTLDIYIYFRSDNKGAYGDDVLSFEEAKSAFRPLARIWRRIVHRTTDARRLAAEGVNPMTGSSGANRWNGGGWHRPENCLWVTERFLPFSGLGLDPALPSRVKGGMRTPVPASLIIPEIAKSTTGTHAYATTRFLGLPELTIAFAMVTMKTGLNPDTLSRMTVDHWSRPDPLNPEKRAILYGPKRVGDRLQRVSSSVVRKTDAYQIIKFVIEIQEPIRRRLMEIAQETGDPEIKRRASLIWIGVLNGALFDFLPAPYNFYKAHRFLDTLFETAGVLREDGSPLRYRMTQGRDVWASFVYHRSGMNYLLTAQALSHTTLGALLNYLEKKQQIVHDRKRLVDLQNKVFTDLKQGQYGPRRYREGYTEMAITGLNCVDTHNPSPEADPGHRSGTTCLAQRCFQCWNWYATKESLPYLIRIIADLEEHRETISLALWETSDHPLELALYQHIVSKFSDLHIAEAKIAAGQLEPIVQTSLFVGKHVTRRTTL
ncbi:hypothetical protein [Muricoccus pecuniae]|uniref:Uncharacterized protein n=1 Tax=Muricoccus pecuniae TaxID=693023 RepID=A0A840YDE2_9PROT|nr:hypothetical protein [Roseomonas pecuniae]MBB5694377.1 hypothetical protein [Roseomonas pecuniae]